MSSFLRAMVRLHLKMSAKQQGPLGPGMAIFLGDHVSNKIILDGAFALSELEVLDRLIFAQADKDAICLDIGANIGNHARYFSQRFSHVYAFEPHPRTSLLLQANAMGRKITALTYGLSDRAADVPAVTNFANMGGAHITDDATDADITFSVKRLDDVIGTLSDAPIGFVKIDVEGHEAQAIEGASATLSAQHPPVAIEVNPDAVQDGTTDSVKALRALGYTDFYGLENNAGWTRISPKVLRNIVRSLLRLFAPSRIYRMDLRRVERLSSAGYPLLVASVGPLASKV